MPQAAPTPYLGVVPPIIAPTDELAWEKAHRTLGVRTWTGCRMPRGWWPARSSRRRSGSGAR
jgi:hypothetical protein